MASPTSAFNANSHEVAVPWTQRFTLATGKRLWVPLLNVTRSLVVRSDTASGVTIAFGGTPGAALTAYELDVSPTYPYSEQVQVTGVWLINRSGGDVVFQVHAVLSGDVSADWPSYTVANNYDAVEAATTTTVADAVTLA